MTFLTLAGATSFGFLSVIKGRKRVPSEKSSRVEHAPLNLRSFFGWNDDQWFSEWQSHLGSEQMEIVCRIRAIDNLHVGVFQDILVVVINTIERNDIILVTHLQKSLHSGWRVLGTVTIVAMGQKHDETISNIPFRLSRDNELINNNLCAIGKVSKLSLP